MRTLVELSLRRDQLAAHAVFDDPIQNLNEWCRIFAILVGTGLMLTALTNPLTVGSFQVPANRLTFALICAVGIWRVFAWVRTHCVPSILALATSGFLASILVANAVHPYSHITTTMLHVGVAVVTALGMKEIQESGATSCVIRSLFAFICLQTIISVLQVLQDGAIGGGRFVETEEGFRRIAGTLSPSGTLGHANQLGIFSVVATTIAMTFLAHRPNRKLDRHLCAAIAIASAALVGLTMCRSAIVALAILLVVALVSHERRKLAPLILAMVLTVAGTAVLRSDGWSARANASIGNAEKSGSGRIALNRQAIAVWKLDPIIGVGPGRYLDAIEEHPEIKAISNETLVVHNVWLYVLAALGAVGISTFTLMGLQIVWRCRRAGVWGIGPLLVVAPLLALDVTLFAANGLLWLGLVIGLALGATKSSGRLGFADTS
jgi:O-antigen ligase